MSSICFYITSRQIAGINNVQCKSIQKEKSLQKMLDIFLCRRPARVIKEDLDAIINAFKNKPMFTIHSR